MFPSNKRMKVRQNISLTTLQQSVMALNLKERAKACFRPLHPTFSCHISLTFLWPVSTCSPLEAEDGHWHLRYKLPGGSSSMSA